MRLSKPGVFDASQWRQRFADSLLKLAPEVNPDAADELSDSQVLDLSEMPPEDAAARFAAASLRPSSAKPEGASTTLIR